MSMYSNEQMEEIGEDIAKIVMESKYPKTYVCLFISGVILTSSCIWYNLL